MDDQKTVTATAFVVHDDENCKFRLNAAVRIRKDAEVFDDFPSIIGPYRPSRVDALADMAMITDAFEFMLRSMGYQDVKWEVKG